jgi:hypothetical protein
MAGKKRSRSLAAEKAAVAWRRKVFDETAMGVVVAALRRGATVRAAAREAGFSEGTVHDWRRRAPHFDAACREALDSREALVVQAPGGGRGWQLRRPQRNAFTERRKQIYLDHFAATGDSRASAAAAAVSKSTVSNHRRNDPVFAEGYRRALALAYETLEAEAVRDRLAAMARIDVDPARAQVAAGEDFDRTLQLLREHKRVPAAKGGRPPSLCSFEEGFAALERELDAFEGREGNGDGKEAPPPPCRRSPSPRNRGEEIRDG